MAKNKTPKGKQTVGKPNRPKKTPASPARRSRESSETPNPQAAPQESSSRDPVVEMEKGDMEAVDPMAAPMESIRPEISQPSAVSTSKMTLPESFVAPAGVAEGGPVANAPEAAADETDEVSELLAFRLADEEYAVDILMIKEIIRPVEITRVPRKPPFIKGIVSLRGTIIPIFDLRTRLGLVESVFTRSSRILIMGLDQGLIGVIADGVTEVVKVSFRDIEPPPATGGGLSSGHLKGVTRVNGRLLILLDIEKAVV